MSPQFKKFIFFIISLVIGVFTFFILALYITNGWLAIYMLLPDLMFAIFITFFSYRFLKKRDNL